MAIGLPARHDNGSSNCNPGKSCSVLGIAALSVIVDVAALVGIAAVRSRSAGGGSVKWLLPKHGLPLLALAVDQPQVNFCALTAISYESPGPTRP